MIRFLLGFGTGVWVGTYYDCKPLIKMIKDEVIKYIPKEK
jgi:hypothetical protein